ncbi:MAG: 2OG-Fe(II) oxygenase [Spongiibacteraceae bacterium]|nr:2OG-Fe(II) oxygenase [Spongiibacteraceae bacterium]
MSDISDKVEKIDWHLICADLHEKGFALVPGFLSSKQCRQVIRLYDSEQNFRKKVVMERYGYGLGEYQYFDYPLPTIVQEIREQLYPKLVPVANTWMSELKIDWQFPNTLKAFQAQCHANQQLKPTPLILKYDKGGFNALHQDMYGDVYFPLQSVFLLNEPGTDFSGGELVLTQQIPRAQSTVNVLIPEKGDMLLFASNFRAVKGLKAFRRVTMKHGVSPLHSGQRHTLGVIFHDAVS